MRDADSLRSRLLKQLLLCLHPNGKASFSEDSLQRGAESRGVTTMPAKQMKAGAARRLPAGKTGEPSVADEEEPHRKVGFHPEGDGGAEGGGPALAVELHRGRSRKVGIGGEGENTQGAKKGLHSGVA